MKPRSIHNLGQLHSTQGMIRSIFLISSFILVSCNFLFDTSKVEDSGPNESELTLLNDSVSGGFITPCSDAAGKNFDELLLERPEVYGSLDRYVIHMNWIGTVKHIGATDEWKSEGLRAVFRIDDIKYGEFQVTNGPVTYMPGDERYTVLYQMTDMKVQKSLGNRILNLIITDTPLKIEAEIYIQYMHDGKLKQKLLEQVSGSITWSGYHAELRYLYRQMLENDLFKE